MNYFNCGKEILNILIDHGHHAYFVGGVVRDSLLGVNIHDIDIATSALPEEIVAIFEDVKLHGLLYQSISINYKSYKFEITTYRKDIEYTDNRHPKVSYTPSLHVDLTRRDFTINALAMDKDENIIDIFGGINDLNNKMIKAVGNPQIKFKEDALRILRAFYFVSKTNFDIESLTLKAINDNASLINKLSNQRVMEEIYKIVTNPYSLKSFCYLSQSEVINYINPLKEGINLIVKNSIVINDITLFYSLCFYFNIKAIQEFRFSREMKTKLESIINLALVTEDENFNRLILYSYGEEISVYANKLNYLLGKNNLLTEEIKKEYNSLPIKKTCDLKFKGSDIILLTNKMNNAWVGNIIDKIKYEILINNLENDYEIIKDFVFKNDLLK